MSDTLPYHSTLGTRFRALVGSEDWGGVGQKVVSAFANSKRMLREAEGIHREQVNPADTAKERGLEILETCECIDSVSPGTEKKEFQSLMPTLMRYMMENGILSPRGIGPKATALECWKISARGVQMEPSFYLRATDLRVLL